MKKIAALALAAVVAVSLSGCTVFDTFISAGDEALLSTDLDTLVDDLSKVPGIDAVDYDLLIQGDMSYTVSVRAYATDISEDSAHNAFARVTETFASGRFPEQQALSFSVGPGADSSSTAIYVSSWLDFPTEVIPDEISYVYDLAEVVGAPLSLQLDPPGDLDVNYQRYVGALTLPESVDWPALRQMYDVGTGTEFVAFNLGGVTMDGGVIPASVEKIAAKTAEIGGIELVWNDSLGEYGLSVYLAGGDYAASRDWPAIEELVALASNGDNGFHSFLVSFDDGMAVVSADECADADSITDDDRALAAKLEAAGADVSPGYCK